MTGKVDHEGMNRHRRSVGILGAILSWSLLVAGCTPRQAVVPAGTAGMGTHVETVAFTTTHDRLDVLDTATSVLVGSNFTITLANERLGLLQTDYVPLITASQALADSINYSPERLQNLVMRVTLNAENRGETTFVQLKGSFQRLSGTPRVGDDLIGLFWLERIGRRIAAPLDVAYRQQLPDSTYAELLSAPVQETAETGRTAEIKRAGKAVGILIAVLFALTLAVGAFGPAQNVPPATE